MKIVVVQPLLAKYSIEFFNYICLKYSHIQITVFADIESDQALNQYRSEDCFFNVRHLSSVQWKGLIFRPGLFGLLRNEGAEIVVFNANPREISQLFGMLVWRFRRRRFTAWGMFHRIGGPRGISSIYYRFIAKLANRCLTYTRVGASHLISLGVPKEKIGIVGTAIDERIPLAERAARTSEELADFRSKQALEGKDVVLQVVRLSRYKRPELLVQAAEILLNKRQNLLFVLIGDGEMRQELEEMVSARGITRAFRFLGAIYDEKLLSFWYLNSTVFVLPTCIGLSAHHAMSYGLPIITDDSLDSQASEFEIIAHGLNAMTYRESDAASLAEAIDQVTTDGDLRSMLSENALRTIDLRANISSKAKNFMLLNLSDYKY